MLYVNCMYLSELSSKEKRECNPVNAIFFIHIRKVKLCMLKRNNRTALYRILSFVHYIWIYYEIFFYIENQCLHSHICISNFLYPSGIQIKVCVHTNMYGLWTTSPISYTLLLLTISTIFFYPVCDLISTHFFF